MPRNTAEYPKETEEPRLEDALEELEKQATTGKGANWHQEEPDNAGKLAQTAQLLDRLNPGRGAGYIYEHLDRNAGNEAWKANDPAYHYPDPKSNSGDEHERYDQSCQQQARWGQALLEHSQLESNQHNAHAVMMVQLNESQVFTPEHRRDPTAGADQQLRSEMTHEFKIILEHLYSPSNPASRYADALAAGKTGDAAQEWSNIRQIMDPLVEGQANTLSEQISLVGRAKYEGTLEPTPDQDKLAAEWEHGRAADPKDEDLRFMLYVSAANMEQPEMAQQTYAMAKLLERETASV